MLSWPHLQPNSWTLLLLWLSASKPHQSFGKQQEPQSPRQPPNAHWRIHTGGEMSEWISCAERLPTVAGTYLVFKPVSAYRVGLYEWLEDEQSWEQEWLRKKRSEFKPKTWVTHWMPVPSLPSD
ncbi:DUF551 domain-containing protein [Pseudomonas aeruginosa]|nr:DUF551 domain-containing protein [Pseudomonas aeruginosa]TWX98641.1 DUF551 domain-containing protein [Pseudomonas aeruginosa]